MLSECCCVLAFSWFSLCEYVIAGCNIGYHMSVVRDLTDLNISIYDKILTGREQTT